MMVKFCISELSHYMGSGGTVLQPDMADKVNWPIFFFFFTFLICFDGISGLESAL